MRRKSTVTNLIELTHFIERAFNNSTQTDVIYLDFSKAFDTISHTILASKLAQLSMPFSLFQTVMSFVSNRQYQMKMDGMPRNLYISTSVGVPQGSHCGPLLFILYTMDIVQCLAGSNVHILTYADDTKLFGH